MRLIILLLCVTCITSCQNINMSSNTGDYIASSVNRSVADHEVRELRYPELYQYHFTPLGAVDSSSCAYEKLDRLPNESYMRKKLKVHARETGANALEIGRAHV